MRNAPPRINFHLSLPIIIIITLTFIFLMASSPQEPSTALANSDLQEQCGIIDNPDEIGFPLDIEIFSIIQPFARVSSRFDGKLHAGEDWINRRDTTLGSPVYAIAPGRVTFSNPTAWGLDKGVVIVQHQISDGMSFYSFYGHMEELNDIEFVANGTCVNKGDVVGAIGSPRPAPHLHFELRTFGPNSPGPGYWEVDPRIRGWIHPRQFIINTQAWLTDSHVWHRQADDTQGPITDNFIREDGVFIMVDGQLLRAYNNDGRIWQYQLADSIDPIALVPANDTELAVVSADGRLQFWLQYGGFSYEWNPSIGELEHEPVFFNGFTFLRNVDDELFIYRGQNLQRQYNDIPAFIDYAVGDGILAIITEAPQMILFDGEGQVIRRDDVSLASNVIPDGTGGLYLRDGGSFERIASNGDRSVIIDDLSVNRSDRAMFVDRDGNIIMWGINGRERLLRMTPDGDILWETDLDISPNILNAKVIQANACTIALADRRGRVYTFDLDTGEILGDVLVYGSNQNQVWLGSFVDDDILRLHIGDQLAGFDTSTLSGRECS